MVEARLLAKVRDDLQRLVHEKEKRISEERNKAADIRGEFESKFIDLKTAFLEIQKESEGRQNLIGLLKQQNTDITKERNAQAELVYTKDNTIDKLKEELIIVTKSISAKVSNPDYVHLEYEEKSKLEFTRLRALTEELKMSQVETERVKMEGLMKDKEYLRLKDQYIELNESMKAAQQQADTTRFENHRLREEQEKFLTELGEVRQVYENQLDSFSSKAHRAAEDMIRYKAKASELASENNLMKIRLEEFKKRVATRDVELEKFTSHKLFEAAGLQMTKPSNFLASPSMLRGALENESYVENLSPTSKDHLSKLMGQPAKVERHVSTTDPWKEDKMKLEWDSLLYRLNSVGIKPN